MTHLHDRPARLLLKLGLGLVLGLATPLLTHAQPSAEALRATAGRAPDLVFPTTVSALEDAKAAMAIYKPEGTGPFPALVLHHQCSGLHNGLRQNESMLEWARIAVRHGYVAFLIDTLGPRGVDTVCMGPKGNITFMRGVRDALQAAAHLQKFDFVDKTRIAHAGYSWGAMVGVALSGNQWATALGEGTRFKAAVSLYPGCFTLKPPSGMPYELVNPDIDKPLLVMMGADDTETPPSDCIPKLEAAKNNGAPVEWHLYAGTTHCWDCRHLNNFRKTDVRGNSVVYRYDEANTRDAERRMFEFLDRALQVKAPS